MPLPLTAYHRLGQETCREAHIVGNLAAEQLVELNLISAATTSE